jgi:hypothetical protein
LVHKVPNSALEVLNNAGVIPSKRSIQNKKEELCKEFYGKVKGWIKNTTGKPSALCLGWDEFVNIHTYQRPQGLQTATIAQMVTIIAHAPNHTAIPFDPN